MSLNASTIPAPSRSTVLLVDDDPRMCAALARTLRREPYEVLTCASASEALLVLERTHVDLVVSDEGMTEMTGTELLHVLARDKPWIGRIMLTGKPTLDVALRAMSEGRIAAFLRKPCAPDELRMKITQVLRSALVGATQSQQRVASAASVVREGGTPKRPFGALPVEEAMRLSPREQDVLQQLVAGRSVAAIAEAFFASAPLVESHVASISRKLGVASRRELLEKVLPGR